MAQATDASLSADIEEEAPTSKKRSRDANQSLQIPAEILQDIEDEEAYEKEQQEAQRQRDNVEDEQLKQELAQQAKQDMVEEGYHAIKLHGCEFLIASDSDGRLNLGDIFVQDDDSGVFARPSVSGAIPEAPQFFSQIEWRHEFLGDVCFHKPPEILVKKVYLIRIAQLEPRRLDLQHVWQLDSDARTVNKEPVQVATQSQDPTELTLRIRRDGSLLIERSANMPSADELIWAAEAGYEAQSRMDIADPDTDVEDPINAVEDDFDEPDVPAVDLA